MMVDVKAGPILFSVMGIGNKFEWFVITSIITFAVFAPVAGRRTSILRKHHLWSSLSAIHHWWVDSVAGQFAWHPRGQGPITTN